MLTSKYVVTDDDDEEEIFSQSLLTRILENLILDFMFKVTFTKFKFV